jgi:hypothetical protein
VKPHQKLNIGASMQAALQHLDHIEDVLTRPSSFYEVLDDMPTAEHEEILNCVHRLRKVIAQAFKRFDLPVTETSRKQVIYFNTALISIAFHDLSPDTFQKKSGELPMEEGEALQAYCDEILKLLESVMRSMGD